ncbi:TetR/AcrR family transcriptional regulator [Thermodesulfobacteriota bacterium]
MRKKQSTQRLGKQTKEASEKTKIRILIAALKVFAKEGFPDAKLRVIAAKAGVTHNLIRHHFGSKDDLWKAVVDYGLKLREDRLKQIIDLGQSTAPVELFKKLIRSHVIFAAENAELAKILMHSNSRTSPHLDYIINRQKDVHRLAEPFFKKCKACGYFKGLDHDSFSVYMRAIAETPIATSDLTDKLLKHDIRSEKGIALHTQRVIDFLFHKDE